MVRLTGMAGTSAIAEQNGTAGINLTAGRIMTSGYSGTGRFSGTLPPAGTTWASQTARLARTTGHKATVAPREEPPLMLTSAASRGHGRPTFRPRARRAWPLTDMAAVPKAS